MTIPNSKPNNKDKVYYKNGQTQWINCATGYEPKDKNPTAKCQNGTWSSKPVCESKSEMCVCPV